jgi:glyoxylase-like metal-dependent hydrolase (beta-lactamase superfamily II)
MLIEATIVGFGFLSWFLTPANPSTSPSMPRIAAHTFEIAGEVIPGHEPDGNTYVLESTKGLTVIDTGRHAAHRQKIEMFAEQRHAAIVAVINTHWHLDHISGNIGLRNAYPEMKVYGSDAIDEAITGFLANSAESSRQMLATGKLDPVEHDELSTDLATIEAGSGLKPDVVLSGAETIAIGGRKLQTHVAKDAATAGDVWVFDPSSGVVFVGDLVTFPAPFLDTACGNGWKSALEQVDRVPFRIVAPGHGPILSREQFRTYSTAFVQLLACSASSETAAACAASWIDQVATIGGMSDSERKLGQGMTTYYVTDVLRAHGGNSAYCAPTT